MPIYDFGGIYDYLEDIHFPRGRVQFPPNVSQPWYYYLLRQQSEYFAAPKDKPFGVYPIFPIFQVLEADSQVQHATPIDGAASLEAAADRYWQTWDQGDRRDPEFFGRIDFSSKFFWKVLGRKYPTWATGLSGLAKSRPNDPNPPIGPYIQDAVEDFYARWNSDCAAYNIDAIAGGTGPGAWTWNPLRTHSFNVPFPPQGITIRQLGEGVANEKYWLGPFPYSAWWRILLFFTQAYCFSYGFGQLDPHEWDLNIWPPRRTSLKLADGGSAAPPSAVSGRYGGVDPFQPFTDHQIELF